jgi:hypothetical protein
MSVLVLAVPNKLLRETIDSPPIFIIVKEGVASTASELSHYSIGRQ